MNMGLIAIIITAATVLVTAIISKKPPSTEPLIKHEEKPPSTEPLIPTKITVIETTNAFADGISATDKIYREIIGKVEIATTALTEEKASQPEVYAASCPPLLYKVSYFDENHNWVSTMVLATSANAAAASLGLVAGYGCFVSSMSGQQESIAYHATGELPTEAIVASTERLAAATKQKAAEIIQEEIDKATIKTYTSYPSADKIGAALICNPPQRSLSSSEKDRIATFRAKNSTYQQEVINAYKAYAAVKGITTIC